MQGLAFSVLGPSGAAYQTLCRGVTAKASAHGMQRMACLRTWDLKLRASDSGLLGLGLGFSFQCAGARACGELRQAKRLPEAACQCMTGQICSAT